MSTGINNTSSSPVEQYQEWLKQRAQEIENLSARMTELQGQIANAQGNLDSLLAARANLESRIAAMEAQLAQMSDGPERDALEAELGALREQLPSLDSDIQRRESEIATLSSQLGVARDALSQLSQGGSSTQVLQDIMRGSTQRRDAEGAVTKNSETDRLGELLRAGRDDSGEIAEKSLETAQMRALSEETEEVVTTSSEVTTPPSDRVTTEDLQKALQALAAMQAQIAQEMQKLMDDIVALQGKTGSARTDLEKLAQQRIELIIKLSVASALSFLDFGATAIYFGVMLANLDSAARGLNREVAGYQAQIQKNLEELKALSDQLAVVDRSALISDIKQIGEIVEKLAKILSGGSISGSQIKEVAALLVQILSLLQVILAKVSNRKSKDQTWMANATQSMYKLTADSAVENMKKVADAQAHAAFMRVVMKAVQIGMAAVSVMMAMATGGTGAIALASLMAALSVTGGMEKITTELADELKKAGCPEAKIVAEVIVGVAAMAATLGVGAVESRLLSSAVEKAAEQGLAAVKASSAAVIGASAARTVGADVVASQAIMDSVVDRAFKEGAKVAIRQAIEAEGRFGIMKFATNAAFRGEVIAAAERAGTAAAQQALNDLSQSVLEASANVILGNTTVRAAAETLSRAAVANIRAAAGIVAPTAGSTAKEAAGSFAYGYLSANGFVDLVSAIALHFKKQSDLDDDSTWQMVRMVLGLVQMVMMMTAMYGASQVGESGKAIAKAASNMNREEAIKIVQGLQALGDGVNVYANLKTAQIMYRLSNAHKAVADDQRDITFYESIMKALNALNKASSDNRAMFFEQQMKAIDRTISSMGRAEREVAVRLQHAV